MVSQWLVSREMLVTYALFIIGLLVSIFANDIRIAFTVPARKYRAMRVEVLGDELRSLKALHENTYALLLYLAHNIFEVLRIMGYAFLVALFIYEVLIILGHKVPVFPFPQFGGGFGGLMAGRAINMSDTLRKLWCFEKSCQRIEAKLAKLTRV